ncbi:MAG TPA: helix-turn-helix transcriptional regulator [Solirubrobacteraceae bacterium]|nr:helix-turn-helix transcriptional regulator [Solirubrobacteraceae bacterium]
MDDKTTDTDDATNDHREAGRALRALRHRASLTQEALAERSGIDVTYVSQVENGRRGVRWHTVMRLLRGLGMSVSDLGAEIDRQQDK